MKIVKAEFITSAKTGAQFIKTDKPVIAVCGKSNVGKSSFINMLANQKKLARTSNTPGRTRLVNYFDFGQFILADLPGYGFAKVSKEEKISWAKTVEDFFSCGQIIHALSLIDVRHNPTQDDCDLIRYFHQTLTPFSVIATKCDKLGKSKIKPQLKVLADYLRMGSANIIGVSSENGYGKDAVLALLDHVLKVNKEQKENTDTCLEVDEIDE